MSPISRTLPCLILLSGLVATCSAQIEGDSPDPRQLVERLGSKRFTTREAAQQKLILIGVKALPAVRDGLKSENAEIRERCERILPILEKLEWQRKADLYQADVEGKQKHHLPLQKEFEKRLGTKPAARRLFAECIRSNGELFQLISADQEKGLERYHLKCSQLARHKSDDQGPVVTLGDFASLLLASIHLKDNQSDWKEPNGVAHLLGHPDVHRAIQDPQDGSALRRLLVHWAKSREVTDVRGNQFFLYFVKKAKFEEGLDVVRSLINNPKATPVNLRTTGVFVLSEVGGEGVDEELGKLWACPAKIFHDRVRLQEGRLGDQALAASIRRKGEKPADWGIQELQIQLITPNGERWLSPVAWFPSDEERQAALKRWKAERDSPQ